MHCPILLKFAALVHYRPHG